jgi:putative Holliday junction resolvase
MTTPSSSSSTTTTARAYSLPTNSAKNNSFSNYRTFFAKKKRRSAECVTFLAAGGKKKNNNNNDDSWSLLDEEMNRAAKNAPVNENFATRRALGIDYGLSKTGLAISSGGLAPRPLESVFCKGMSRVELIREIVSVAERERADVYVVGYPRQTQEESELLEEKIREVTESNARNKENKKVPIRMHRVCEQFAEALAQASATCERKIPVEMYDESFTSDEAMAMKRGSLASDDPRLDSIAAALLLERYFEKTDGEPILIFTPTETPPSPKRGSSWGNRKK